MKLIKVAGSTLNQTPRDWKGNKENILEAIKQAKEEKVSVLCLPEMCLSGYNCEDDFFSLDLSHRSLIKLKEIVPYTENLIVCVGLPIVFDNSLYNAVATIVNQEVVGFVCKNRLAGEGIHYESRWFKSWPEGIVKEIKLPELDDLCPYFQIGDIHFKIDGVKIAYEICEAAWVSQRIGGKYANKGVDIILNPSASHFSFGKLTTRINLVVDGSRAFNATYIYTNLNGNEAGRAIYDGGTIIASNGKLLKVGKRFSYKNVVLTTAVIDIDNTRTQNIRTASFQPDIENEDKGCIPCGFNFPEVQENQSSEINQESWENSKDIKHQECMRAVGLGLMDYIRKSHTKGFVISLSGGADSAMVSYLCYKGIQFGVKELGMKNFVEKYCPYFSLKSGDYSDLCESYLCKKLITTAYQSTNQSSQITINAAREVAHSLNTTHFEFDVQPIMEDYMEIGKIINNDKELNFKDNGLVLQNLQARTRSPSIWIVANKENKLLLTTSNMSESAVGYCTMDGDTSGSLGPICGLSKTYIREFLRWLTKDINEDYIIQNAMKLITNQQPTAELLPKEYNQTDEKDLMPYDLLHEIQSMVVKNRYVPVEIYKSLKSNHYYALIENNKLIDYITKFFKLFSQNQWKRERFAVSFHLDDHNLDPRSWCRTPILTGGYEEELEELSKYRVKVYSDQTNENNTK